MVKVVQVVSDTNIGGAGRYLLNYLKYYDRQSYEVTVVLPENSRLIPFVEEYGVTIIKAPHMADRSYDKRCVSYLTESLWNLRPAILHTHASLSARMAGRKAKVPKIVSTRHCIEPVTRGPKSILKGRINNYFSDVFIGVSEAVVANLIACGVSKRKVHLVPNGVEPLVRFSEERRMAARENFGFSEEDTVFGIVGRVEAVKGHKFFVEAAAMLDDPHAKFLVVGDGSLLGEVEKQADALGLAGRMVFTGYLSDTTEAMNAMDVNVISSYSEAMSLALLEAMSLGKPSVATDAGGTREAVRDGKTGLLVPVADAAALAAAMERMLRERPLRQELSERVLEDFAKNRTARTMVSRLEKLYEEVISHDHR